jgi:hypothetical protein
MAAAGLFSSCATRGKVSECIHFFMLHRGGKSVPFGHVADEALIRSGLSASARGNISCWGVWPHLPTANSYRVGSCE